jgi:hypothetical protein
MSEIREKTRHGGDESLLAPFVPDELEGSIGVCESPSQNPAGRVVRMEPGFGRGKDPGQLWRVGFDV